MTEIASNAANNGFEGEHPQNASDRTQRLILPAVQPTETRIGGRLFHLHPISLVRIGPSVDDAGMVYSQAEAAKFDATNISLHPYPDDFEVTHFLGHPFWFSLFRLQTVVNVRQEWFQSNQVTYANADIFYIYPGVGARAMFIAGGLLRVPLFTGLIGMTFTLTSVDLHYPPEAWHSGVPIVMLHWNSHEHELD